MEFRINDIEKIDNIEKMLTEMSSTLKTHIEVDKVAKQLVNEKLELVSMDIRDQRQHFDALIERNRVHFDERISACNDDIHKVLKEDYVTKSEIYSLKDETILKQVTQRAKAIEDAKVDIMTRVRNYGAIVVGTIILFISIVSYIMGIKL